MQYCNIDIDNYIRSELACMTLAVTVYNIIMYTHVTIRAANTIIMGYRQL